MKRLMATWLLGALFTTAFVAGKGTPAAPAYPDSLPSVWFYPEGLKQQTITGDTLRARKLFAEAIRRDSNYAPAYFELVSNGMRGGTSLWPTAASMWIVRPMPNIC